MQGLLLVVCMLALALVNIGTLAESISSALVTLSGLEEHELKLRIDIDKTSPPCGPDANVTLNGQRPARDEGVASGQISLNRDQSIAVGSIDGSTRLKVGFIRRFQPNSKVGISDIEGPTSATRFQNQPDLDLISNSHGKHESSPRRNTDLLYEIVQLDYLRAQLVDFKQRILVKKHQLPENFGWESGKKMFKECASIRCMLQTAYDQARNAAKNLYLGILRESHMKRHGTQNHRPQNYRHGCQEHDNSIRPHLPLQNSLSFCKLPPASPPYNGLAKHHPTAPQGLLHGHPYDPPRGPTCGLLDGKPPHDIPPKEPPKELQPPEEFPDIEDEESFSNRHAEDEAYCGEERDPPSLTKDGGDRPIPPPDDSEGDKHHTPLPPPPHHHHDGKEESPPDRQPGHSPVPGHKARPPLLSPINVLFTDPSITAYEISATVIIIAILLVVLHSRYCAYRHVQVSRHHRRRAALFSVWHSTCQNSSLPRRIMFWRRSAGSVSNPEEHVDGILAMIGNNSDARSDNISTTMEQEIAELRTAASIVGDMVAAEEGRAQARC